MRHLLDFSSMEVSPVMEIEPLLKEKREEILQIAYRHGAKNLRLFGSMARGEADESSDVDILVEVGETTSPWFRGGADSRSGRIAWKKGACSNSRSVAFQYSRSGFGRSGSHMKDDRLYLFHILNCIERILEYDS